MGAEFPEVIELIAAFAFFGGVIWIVVSCTKGAGR